MTQIRVGRKKMKTGKLLIPGILAAAAAVILFFAFRNGIQLQKAAGAVYVYVLNEDVRAGNALTNEMVKLVSVSSESAVNGLGAGSDFTGSALRIDAAAGTVLTAEMIRKAEAVPDDIRIQKFETIAFTEKVKAGDYVDVRISFGNGQDFVVLARKKVEDISRQEDGTGGKDALWFAVSEEELLRMSSAAVDAYINEGVSIYAAVYADESQRAAVVTYPSNAEVEAMIAADPNVITHAERYLAGKLDRSTLKSASGQNSTAYTENAGGSTAPDTASESRNAQNTTGTDASGSNTFAQGTEDSSTAGTDVNEPVYFD